jgi:hypothetical protein
MIVGEFGEPGRGFHWIAHSIFGAESGMLATFQYIPLASRMTQNSAVRFVLYTIRSSRHAPRVSVVGNSVPGRDALGRMGDRAALGVSVG